MRFFSNYMPVCQTYPSDDVATGSTYATGLKAAVNVFGNPAYIEKGFCYSATNYLPTVADTKYMVGGNFANCLTGALECYNTSIYGLTPNTTYYYRAYILSETGISYGNIYYFTTTIDDPAVVTTADVSNITATGATLNGAIVIEGNPAYTEKGFCYNMSPDPTIYMNKKEVIGEGTGSFSYQLTELSPRSKYYVRAYAIQNGNTIYGNEVDFITTAPLSDVAEVTTSAVTNIAASTATFNAIITNEGNPAYTEKGFCYDTDPNPTTSHYRQQVSGSGTGAYSYSGAYLTANTKYYVRAYLRQNGNTIYGNQVEFTTAAYTAAAEVTTSGAADITATEATLTGQISYEGIPAYTERGFCYATSPNPTTANNKSEVSGSGSGSYFYTVTGLAPNTKYYVKTYLIWNGNTVYGNEVEFTTAVLVPEIYTSQVTNITATAVTLNARISNVGVPAYTERGFCYNIDFTPTISTNKIEVSGNESGAYAYQLTGLTANTSYYVSAYVIQEGIVYYGQIRQFKTAAIPAVVTTDAVTNITYVGATFNGTVSVEGTPPYTERGFCYKTSPNPTVANNQIKVNGSGTGAYSYNNTVGLSANQTYYLRAYVYQDGVYIYGNEVEFTTGAIPVGISTNAATNITYTGATLNAAINNLGTPAYTERGFCYGTSQHPTTSNNKIAVTGSGLGAYSYNLTGLMTGTKYYVRAYAIQNGAPTYGEEISFTTAVYNIEPEMAYVIGGTVTMNDATVALADFRIGKYEVTQKLWWEVMGSWSGTAPSSAYGVGDDYPMYNVSWTDIVGTTGASYTERGVTYYADGFCYKLYQLTGKKYRLPTEAEWQYAANGGDALHNYTYSGSNTIGDVAWYNLNSSSKTHPVGTKATNLIGIYGLGDQTYDMSGNVYEWCGDWYGSSFPSGANPTGATSGTYHVYRGGGWDSSAANCTVSNRSYATPGTRNNNLGFRLVYNP
ncbi:MAG: formylglycine-generating enzyme family protein [Candidatus Symbiothrix sp.]|nr:formylglycine-generating enzyme family protein [Candidatus Symbiothrix sp.]